MLVVVLILLVVVVALLLRRELSPPAEPMTPVEMRAIRSRLETAWFKHELRRDAAIARRELRDELRRLSDDA